MAESDPNTRRGLVERRMRILPPFCHPGKPSGKLWRAEPPGQEAAGRRSLKNGERTGLRGLALITPKIC